jgi:uncharacterized heparinase superfamily protein
VSTALSATRYWHTLRHLKPVQWYGRLWFKLWRPRLDQLSRAPAHSPVLAPWNRPASRISSMRAPDRFCLLNQEHSLPATGGWNDAALAKLWLYNLHYFDDLNAAGAASRVPWHTALLQRWVAENPPTAGNGWEPYPTSLRIVNWVKWSLAGNTLPDECVQSLAVQARWLTARMEWHLLGNHLFANAKALVYAGLFFEGTEADKWLTNGLAIIARELLEQVLPDGGHFERSPMYHAIFLEDLLDLLNVAAVWPRRIDSSYSARWRKVAGDMLLCLEGLLHPDGQIALFNDAAIGIAPEPAALRDFATRLGHAAAVRTAPKDLSLEHWADSGYIRMASAAAVALLDVAPVGPDYLPGHAHADTLSFELSVAGQRVIVNGGTSRYGLGPQRLQERSTSAHSTVEVAGQDSSEVWGGFRVARRARPFALQTDVRPDRLRVECSHDGYRRLAGQPIHRRVWLMGTDGLTVTDTVTKLAERPAVARYILHPAVRVERAGDRAWTATLPSGALLGLTVATGRGELEPAQYAPEFGKVLETHCLSVQLVGGQGVVHIEWN